MTVMGVARFERFFRTAAGLNIDKNDLKRYSDFVHSKLYDLLARGEANARANLRPSIEPFDLPITKGLQECIHEFEKLDEDVQLEPILAQLSERPPLDLPLGFETEARLPEIVGGLSVALARAFKIVDPKVKHPQTKHWERIFALFHLLL
jgi:hypothetical protein